jgi:hypothetical protein
MQPADLDAAQSTDPSDPNARPQCAGCHVSGAYVASPRIAPYLMHYGLINDTHDTFGQRYHAVGSTFNHWNTDFIQAYNAPNGCSTLCHSLGSNSPVTDITEAGGSLIPSLALDIRKFIGDAVIPAATFTDPNGNAITMMPANDSPFNPFRFVNMDSPLKDVGDIETISALQTNFPGFWCANPTGLDAHVIPRRSGGSLGNEDFSFNEVTTNSLGGTVVTLVESVFSTNDPIPDLLHTFNLRDGLVCVNAEQPGGRVCRNYQVRYFCGINDGGPVWSQWFDTDSPATDGTGDDESRSKVNFNVVALCGGGQPIGMQARVAGTTVSFNAPNDRLVISPAGLVCNNADQHSQPGDDPSAICSNYAVRFDCPTSPPTVRLQNLWAGTMLTASGTQNNASAKGQPLNPTWFSQMWVVQPVPNTNNVRLQSVWSGRYLNDQSQADKTNVVVFDLNASWLSEQWVIEPIKGNLARLRNVWSGNYLNVVDTSNFSNVLSQVLNPAWWSEQWIIQ